MKKIILIVILLIAVSLSAFEISNWVTKFDGNSKLHFGACYVLNAMGHVISKYYITDDRVWNSVIGGTFAMAIGIKKEYNDAGDSFDWDGDNLRDLRDDFFGTSASIISMQLLEPIKIIYAKDEIGIEFAFNF